MFAPNLSTAAAQRTATLEISPAGHATSTESSIQTIFGRLIHSNGYPAGRQRLQLVSPGWCCDTIVDSTETDKKGSFKFSRQVSQCPSFCCSSNKNFILRVIEETSQVKDWLGNYKEGECVVDNIEVTIPADEAEVHLGDYSIDLYGYQKGLPALLQRHNPAERIQQWTVDYLLSLAKAGFESIIKAKAAEVLQLRDPQAILCLHNAPNNPELSLTGDDTLEMLLNGIHPAYFQKTNTPNVYTVEINWDRYETDPHQTPLMVNATLTVKKFEERLKVLSVKIDDGEAEKIYQAGEEGFSRALYLFNSMAGIKGQAHFHLGRGHFLTEQNAMAAFKFLNRNNFKKLVFPHLRGVMEINRVGSSAIFGDEASVLVRSTGLTSKGLNDILKDTLAGTCYTTFKPKEPIAANDRFAIAGKLFWKIIHEAVEEFFQKNTKSITENWNEIFYMSKSLVENSLPYHPLEGKSHDAWVDGNEIDDPAVPGRENFEGALRAMRPITLSEDTPQEGDLERLKQFARFAIYTSTFWHWVVHASQGKWMTNFKFGSLAPNKGATPENYGNTSPEHMNQILTLSGLLTRFVGGSITENENGDIYAGITERIKNKREDFRQLGFDIDKCFYGTII